MKLNVSQVSKITGKSSFTVMYVGKSKDLEDYFDITREARGDNKKAQPVKEIKPEDFNNSNSIITLLRAIEHNQQKMIALMEQKKNWFGR